MHLPSLTAVKWDENFKKIYARLVSKHGIKMKALVAIQRKLLELIYVLFKNETNYDKQYVIKIACKHIRFKHAIETGSMTALRYKINEKFIFPLGNQHRILYGLKFYESPSSLMTFKK